MMDGGVNWLHFEHYGEAERFWRWPNFTPFEMACRAPSTIPADHGELQINFAFMDRLQALRDLYGKPMVVTSGYRTPDHNERAGGLPTSYHLTGRAADVRIGPGERAGFTSCAHRSGFTGIGWYQTFIHIDDRAHPTSWIGP